MTLILNNIPSPYLGFSGGSGGKESTCIAGDLGLILELGRCPGEGNSYPLQYSGLGREQSDRNEWLSLSHPSLKPHYYYYPICTLRREWVERSLNATSERPFRELGLMLLWVELCPPKKCIAMLIPGSYECDLTWKQGLCRCSQIKMRLLR